jgi:hypothetical protein
MHFPQLLATHRQGHDFQDKLVDDFLGLIPTPGFGSGGIASPGNLSTQAWLAIGE